MAGTFPFTKGVAAAGRTFQQSKSIAYNNAIESPLTSLGAAKTGTLTTRTDNTSGTLTMSGGHGFITGDRIDVYFVGGTRYGVVVGTVATNSVPISGGAGDNLPIATSAITAMVPTQLAVVITGNNAKLVAAQGPAGKRSTFVYTTSVPADVKAIRLSALSPGDQYIWADELGDGTGNPLAGGAVARLYVSHEDAVAAQSLYAVTAY